MTEAETLAEEGYQLAPQQLVRSGEAASTAVCTVRTAGRIAVRDLEARIAAIVAEYEILRTRYTEPRGLGTVVQVVDPMGPVTTDRPEPGRTVLRAGALTVEHEDGPDGTRLVLSLPRLSVDDTSWSQLVSLLIREAVTDAPADLQYADVAAWLAEVLEHAPVVIGDTARPWTAPGFLRPANRDDAPGVPASTSSVVEGAALEQLAALAERCGVSEPAVVLTLWSALHGRYLRDADDRMVVLSDGRSTEGLAGVLGLLERPVPVQVGVAADLPIGEALRAAEAALRLATATENDVDPAAAGGAVSFRHRVDDWADAVSVRLSGNDFRSPLHLDCVRGPRSLRLTFLGAAGRVAQSELDGVAEAFGHQLIDLLTGDESRNVGRLRLTAPNNSARPASEPNGSETPELDSIPEHPVDLPAASLPERFLGQAARVPEQPALRCGESVLSYREVSLHADAVAQLLREHGVRSGERVALLAPTSASTIVGMLGIWLAGAAFVPIDPTWPQQRIETILREADPALLLVPSPQADLESPVRTATAVFDPESSVRIVAMPDVVVDGGRPVIESVEAVGAAYVIFTSGTSGVPKGVVIGHRQVAQYAAAIEAKLDLSEGAEFAAVSTLAADLAYTAIFPTLASGGCVQLIPAETATSPAGLTDWFREHPADAMKLVPSLLAVLLAETADPLALLPREALVLGGEVLPGPLYDRLREVAPALRVYNHYGPTETTVGASCVALGDVVDDRCSSVPVGDGLGANSLTVVDDAGAALPPWCPGEVVISGPGVGLGYLARLRDGLPGFTDADLTAESGIPARYHSGDLGRLVPGSGIEILGRIDDQVKLRGYRVQIGEIETLLTGQAGIGAAAVMARAESTGLVTHLDAYLVAAAGAPDPSIEQMRVAVAEFLPAALVPTGWQILERLPLTGNGKLDRRALVPVVPPKAGAGRPRNSVEQRLVAIWSAVLGQDVTSPDAHFFALGGQSLRAIKLMSQVNAAFGCQLPMSAVFGAPTVAELAELIGRELET